MLTKDQKDSNFSPLVDLQAQNKQKVKAEGEAGF